MNICLRSSLSCLSLPIPRAAPVGGVHKPVVWRSDTYSCWVPCGGVGGSLITPAPSDRWWGRCRTGTAVVPDGTNTPWCPRRGGQCFFYAAKKQALAAHCCQLFVIPHETSGIWVLVLGVSEIRKTWQKDPETLPCHIKGQFICLRQKNLHKKDIASNL